MSRARKKIVLDVSNLTMHSRKWLRTGIQEVLYQTLLAVPGLRKDFPDSEIQLLPFLPRRFGNIVSGATVLPYPDNHRFILEDLEDSLGMKSHELWGFDLRKTDFGLTTDQILGILSEADYFHIQAVVNITPLCAALGRHRPVISATVHDISPILFPEFCDDRIPPWFKGAYLPSLAQYADLVVGDSRNTALDLVEYEPTSRIPRIAYLPLPFGFSEELTEDEGILKRLDLNKGEYVVYLGSLEPRKNFEALLEGFEVFKQGNPSAMKLVLVGSTGWKNTLLEKMISCSPFSNCIVSSGYLDDPALKAVIRGAAALAMLSHYEGFGLPLGQAVSLGTPVITNMGSSLPEASCGLGVFVDSSDPHSVAAGIARASRMAHFDPENVTEIRERTWKEYTRLLLELIQVGPCQR